MKVILTQDIAGIGNIGDLVTVKDGFGRNYLIPEGKGIQATSQNIKKLEHQKRRYGKSSARRNAKQKSWLPALKPYPARLLKQSERKTSCSAL